MKLIKYSTFIISVLFLASFAIPPTAIAQQSQNITLAGYKMKPRVGTSGSGVVDVTLHGDTLSVAGGFSDLMGQYSGAYIMVNIRGKSGNQLYDLTAEVSEDKKSGTFKAKENRFVLSPSEKALLKKGELFITVNTFEHQRGEIRGNIGSMDN